MGISALMNLSRFSSAILALSTAAGAFGFQDDTFEFKRTYKVGDSYQYTLEMRGKPDGEAMTTFLTEAVKTVLPDGAVLDLTAVLNMKEATDTTNQSATSKFGVQNFPDQGTSHDASVPFMLMGCASATTGEKVKVGDSPKVHWQNADKDMIADLTGKVTASDKDAKTLTVEWDGKLLGPGAPEATTHFKSVYSTVDFSLVSSDGTVAVGGTTLYMKFARKSK